MYLSRRHRVINRKRIEILYYTVAAVVFRTCTYNYRKDKYGVGGGELTVLVFVFWNGS